ncbi:MAG: SHOCT domain-containing protein [Nitrospiraceae bacterium]
MRWRFLLLTALGSCLLQACAGPQQARIVCGQCEEEDRFVRLQVRNDMPGPDRRPFAHPAQLSQQDWTLLLRSVRTQRVEEAFPLLASKDAAVEAFTADETAYLSETFVQAFAKAGADDWVLVALTRKPSPDIRELTTGACYIEGERLHLLLANYRYPVTMPGVRSLLWEQPLYAYPPFYAIATGEHQTIARHYGLQGRLVASGIPDITIEIKPVLLAAIGSKAGAPSGNTSEARPEPAEGAASGLSIEDSLALLQRLKERGLVTDDEYRQKKQQLLKRF